MINVYRTDWTTETLHATLANPADAEALLPPQLAGRVADITKALSDPTIARVTIGTGPGIALAFERAGAREVPPETRIPTAYLPAVIRCVTWIGRDADWHDVEAWAARAGVDHVAGILATCEAAASSKPMTRGAWALYLLNPDPSRTGKSGVSPRTL